MILKHNTLEYPDNLKVKIWRYFDFAKFISLLDKSALFFCRVDKLGDQFEMTRPKYNLKQTEIMYNDFILQKKINFSFSKFNDILNQLRQGVLVNSWHINEYESSAMWSSYLKSNEGIAIQSTFELLKDTFSISNDSIYLSKVKYIDYEFDKIDDDSIFGLVTHKLKSYSHESELRAIIKSQMDESLNPLFDNGNYIEVDLKLLIQKIFIAPNTPDWFMELVKSLVKKYEYDFEVVRSSLNDNSLF